MGTLSAGLAELVRELRPGQTRLFPIGEGVTVAVRDVLRVTGVRAEIREDAAGVYVTRTA